MERSAAARNLAATGVAAFASAGLGAAATTPDAGWYDDLEKPPWDPPKIAYPLVWTPLYVDIAVTSAAALTALEEDGRDDEAAVLRRMLALNLALNTGWSVLFWRVRRPWLSAAWCGVLTASSLDLVRRLGRRRRPCTTRSRRTPPGAPSPRPSTPTSPAATEPKIRTIRLGRSLQVSRLISKV